MSQLIKLKLKQLKFNNIYIQNNDESILIHEYVAILQKSTKYCNKNVCLLKKLNASFSVYVKKFKPTSVNYQFPKSTNSTAYMIRNF